MTTLAERLRDRWSVLDSTANFADLSEHEAMIAIAERDGFSEAVQFIDLLTGGDGEYRYCAIPSERHCPDPVFMALRIAARLSPSPAPQSFEAARHAAFGTANREHDFDGGDCSPEYIFDCGWDAALIAAEALKPSPAPGVETVEHRIAMEMFGPQAAKMAELIKLVASENGRMSAEDERVALFCDDGHGIEDTINRCFDAGYLDQMQAGDNNFVVVLLDKGRAALSALGTDAAKEREVVVAWLRGLAEWFEYGSWPEAIANALERGDHLGGDNG